MSTILYVEDDPNDIFLMLWAFKRACIDVMLHTVTEGHEAVAYLSGAGKYADRKLYPVPDLVLLDLKMPGLSGLDVLKGIRKNTEIPRIPILILSSSNQAIDKEKASKLGADGYLVKPSRMDELIDMIKSLKKYWVSHDLGKGRAEKAYGAAAGP